MPQPFLIIFRSCAINRGSQGSGCPFRTLFVMKVEAERRGTWEEWAYSRSLDFGRSWDPEWVLAKSWGSRLLILFFLFLKLISMIHFSAAICGNTQAPSLSGYWDLSEGAAWERFSPESFPNLFQKQKVNKILIVAGTICLENSLKYCHHILSGHLIVTSKNLTSGWVLVRTRFGFIFKRGEDPEFLFALMVKFFIKEE